MILLDTNVVSETKNTDQDNYSQEVSSLGRRVTG
jgi:hypothetical protein